MPYTPPDPLQIVTTLGTQLEQIRVLVASYPSVAEYQAAADLVSRAIQELRAGTAEPQK